MQKKLLYENTLSKKSLDFLIKAHKQKNPLWIERNSAEYETVLKKPFIQLAENIKSHLQPLARDYHFPTKGLGRIKRAAFKVEPGEALYKDWLSMISTRPSTSRFESHPHLFFGLFANETDKVIVAAGLWQPTSQQTKLIRKHIATQPEVFHKLFKNKKFKARFSDGFWTKESTERVPKGFLENHPDVGWIKLKKFVVYKVYSVKELSQRDFHKEVIEDFKQGLELNKILDEALGTKPTNRLIATEFR